MHSDDPDCLCVAEGLTQGVARRVAGRSAVLAGSAAWSTRQRLDAISGLVLVAPNLLWAMPPTRPHLSSVRAPLLVLSGSRDCINNPREHGLPIYEGAASSLKVLAIVHDATHARWRNDPPWYECSTRSPAEQWDAARTLSAAFAAAARSARYFT